jgi:hypothetical protein
MKPFIMLLSIALLASCANPSAKTHIKNIESQIVVTDSGEDFISFYHHFVSDSIFQTERVVFPIYVTWSRILDTGAESDSAVYYAENTDWEYMRMRDYQESDQDTQKLTFNNDSTEANLKMLLDQTIVSTSYISEKGKWYLSDYTFFDWPNGW